MTGTADPALAHSDEFRDRLNDALVLINQILDANPYGAPIADPVTSRIHRLLAEHYVEAALSALAKLMPWTGVWPAAGGRVTPHCAFASTPRRGTVNMRRRRARLRRKKQTTVVG